MFFDEKQQKNAKNVYVNREFIAYSENISDNIENIGGKKYKEKI